MTRAGIQAPRGKEAPGLRPIFDSGWRSRALAGDADAVQALAEANLQPLYRFCFYRLGRDQHVTEEVVQETLLRALRELDHYEPVRAGGNVFPWLTGLARNEIHRALAREKNAVSLESLWTKMDKELSALFARLDSEPFGADVLEREETRDLVNATMSQLPAHYREALEAKYVNGRSVRDLATTWSVSEKAAESQLGRARRAFRVTFLALSRNLQGELC
jgi:RNA polymerase sigma-70 factor (ECF subfamily)